MARGQDTFVVKRAILCCLAIAVFMGATLPQSLLAATRKSTPPPKHWMQFELMESDDSGVVRAGKDLVLSITVGGVTGKGDSILAMIESAAFQSQTVSLGQDTEPMIYQGTAILESKLANKSLTTVYPKAARIRVTLARPKAKGLDEFMKRDIYITLGEPDEDLEFGVAYPMPALSDEAEVDGEVRSEVPDRGLAVNVTIAEEDLLPLPPPLDPDAYWKQVSGLISRTWSRQVRQIRRAPSGESVRVRFKLYSSGVAQLIQLEKGSGARDINEAGIQSIITAHPFPPVPSDLNGELVDVHVRMRTGVRGAPADVETTVEKKPAKKKTPASKSQAK